MSQRALIPSALTLTACAQILGGLDEGTDRRRASDAGIDVTEASISCRSLEGYAYRLPIHIEHHGPAISGYQVKLTFPSSELVARGQMRADGSDIALTLADGITPVAHWLAGGVGTPTTTVWGRFDLGTTNIDGWLYYGNASARDRSSMEETFVQAVIDNPYFDRDAVWAVARDGLGEPTSSNQWWVRVGSGAAELFLATQPHPNGSYVAVCQTIDPPAGEYRIVFDLELLLQQTGTMNVSVRPLTETSPLWSSRSSNLVAPAQFHGLETAPFQAAQAPLCLGANAIGSSDSPGLHARFSKVRMRRWLANDRIAVVAGTESSPCAP